MTQTTQTTQAPVTTPIGVHTALAAAVATPQGNQSLVSYSMRDDWLVAGHGKNECISYLGEIACLTKIVAVRSEDIAFMTPCYEGPDTLKVSVTLPNPQNPGMAWIRTIPRKQLDKMGMQGVEYDEMKNNHTSFISAKNGVFFWSPSLLTTLEQRIAVADKLLVRYFGPDTELCRVRDNTYGQFLRKSGGVLSVMYRELDNGCKKAYAAFGGRYGVQSQAETLKEILDVYEPEMGTADVTFAISNFMTDIILTFPQKADDVSAVYKLPDKLIPCLHIYMSDTGASSTWVEGGWIKNGHLVLMPEAQYQRMHTRAATPTNTVNAVYQRVFPEYTQVPERLSELIRMNDIPANRVHACIKDIFGEVKLNASPVAANLAAEMTDYLCARNGSAYDASPYDVAMSFLDLPGEFGFASRWNPTVAGKVRTKAMAAIFSKKFEAYTP